MRSRPIKVAVSPPSIHAPSHTPKCREITATIANLLCEIDTARQEALVRQSQHTTSEGNGQAQEGALGGSLPLAGELADDVEEVSVYVRVYVCVYV